METILDRTLRCSDLSIPDSVGIIIRENKFEVKLAFALAHVGVKNIYLFGNRNHPFRESIGLGIMKINPYANVFFNNWEDSEEITHLDFLLKDSGWSFFLRRIETENVIDFDVCNNIKGEQDTVSACIAYSKKIDKDSVHRVESILKSNLSYSLNYDEMISYIITIMCSTLVDKEEGFIIDANNIATVSVMDYINDLRCYEKPDLTEVFHKIGFIGDSSSQLCEDSVSMAKRNFAAIVDLIWDPNWANALDEKIEKCVKMDDPLTYNALNSTKYIRNYCSFEKQDPEGLFTYFVKMKKYSDKCFKLKNLGAEPATEEEVNNASEES